MEALSAFLGRFSWRDALDILIVSVTIYELFKLMRGTRAIQMAAGVGVIVGLFYLSRWLHLQTVNWLIRNIVGYVVFAAIVLFQTDIRRALVHFGRTPFFGGMQKTQGIDDVIEDLGVAASVLASHRTGAIIAIEREVGLRNYIEGGIPLDATLTYDLIVSVFQPRSPLHDGAVIVQGDRIAAAACFLPLTVNPRVSKDFGTRHRAAIGLTEETDAVAIVVSEETGIISIAVEGAVQRPVTPEQLRARLRTLLVASRSTAHARAERETYE
ncbi:MAG: diadenylate cyclase CdaA [Vicinamibacterales bacterium]